MIQNLRFKIQRVKKTIILILTLCLSASWAYPDDINWLPEPEKNFDYYYLEGLRLKYKGDYSESFEAFQSALEIDSTSSAAQYEVAQYYLDTEDIDSALKALNKAVEYNPANADYKTALADLNRESGHFEEAISLYESLTAEYPDRPELHFYLSELYMRVNKIDKAVESLDNLENNIGLNEMVSMQKYRMYLFLGQNDKALNEIEKLADKFPAESRYIIIIGDHYLRLGDNDKALEYYDKAHSIEPDSPYYFVSMANYYEQTGNDEMVYREIENALKNPRLDIDIKLGILGKYIQNIFIAKKDKELIIPLMETLLEQHPQEKELNLMYGEFLMTINRPDDAKFQFQLVTEAEPDNLKAWSQLLAIAVKGGDTNEIIEASENAILHFPDKPEFYYYQAMGYYIKQDYKKALGIFEHAVLLVPDSEPRLKSDFYGQIGDLYHQLGNKKKTYEAYEKALQYNENNVMVLNNYAYYLALDKQDLDRAERMSAKTVQVEPNNATYIDTYAWVFFQQGNYSLAKFYIESALSKSGGRISGDILEHYGDILYMNDDKDKAVEEWKKAFEKKTEEDEDTSLLERKIKNKTYYE